MAAAAALVLFFFHVAYSQWLVPETCVAPDFFIRVNPEADIIIGAILRVHNEGEGVYGCGRTNVEGLEVFEAMRWAVSILNQGNGDVNGKPVTDSFIPGVQIGLQVYDSCSHQDVATSHVTNLFPILKSGSMTCRPENTSLLAGLIDMADIERNNLLIENLRRYTVPVVPVRLGSIVPAEQLARVLAEIAHDLEWEKLAIIHADDEHSVHTTKQFGQISRSGKPCIIAVYSIPSEHITDVKPYRKILSLVTNRLENNTGIIIIANGRPLTRLMQAMLETPETTKRLQWLFSWIPPEDEMSRMPNGTHVYGVAPYPDFIRPFEDYWEALRSISSAGSLEDRWFLSYLSFSTHCRLPGQHGSNLAPCPPSSEVPFTRLTRTSRTLAAVHAVFTFAHALKNSWQASCGSTPGICSGLRQMSRRQFVKEFLEPLEFNHDVANRSPPEITGKRVPTDREGEMAGIKLALTVYDVSFGPKLIYRQAVAYDVDHAEVVDVNVKYIPSLCPRKGCNDCVRVRQSRVEHISDEEIITIGKSDALMIPLLLPIHEQGSYPLVCGSRINSHAIQDLEAALWTIDMINNDQKFLPGIQLGVSVIDTCSSSIKVREKLAKFLARHTEDTDGVDIDVALAVMISASAEEAVAAASMLSPFNISTVSANDIRLPEGKLGSENYLFQIVQPVRVWAIAVVDVLKYLGWSYVSMLYDNEAHNIDAAQEFRRLAVKEGICLAFDANFEDNNTVAFELAKAWYSGARAVVTFLSESSARLVLTDVRRSGAFNPGDIMWIANSYWMVEDGDDFASGTLFLHPQKPQMEDYLTYYRKLVPESNKRNPWFAEYWKQQLGCTDLRCAPLPFHPGFNPSYSSQAIVAMAAGLARLTQQVCPSEKGLCTKLLHSNQFRPAISHYIQYTASGSPEDASKLFTFTPSGYGDMPFDIYFYRRSVVNNYDYKKVGVYHSGYVNMSKLMIFNEEGNEIRLDDKRSECISDCGYCVKQDWLLVNSQDNLYITTTMNVHQSAKNPLQCGSLSASGIQKVEAFLWALDQLNSHPTILPGVQIGGVILDVCSSREKTARDISNFFSHSLPSSSSDVKPPSANQLIGILAGETSHEVLRVVDVTMPLNITTVAPVAASSRFNELERYEYLLRLSPPNNILIDGLVSVLKHFQWSYVSVIYEEDHLDAYTIFRNIAKLRGIILALDEKLSSFSNSEMNSVLSRLSWKMKEGARVVILFLTTTRIDQLLSLAEHTSTFGRPIWLTPNNIDVFYQHPQISLGAISIRTATSSVALFMDHFVHLSLLNNTRNPWFREYWESMFMCRGASCYNSSQDTNRQTTFLQDPQVAGIINGVFALGYGLEKIRQALCQSKVRGICPQMGGMEELRQVLKDSVRKLTFTGVDGKIVRFRNQGYSPGWYNVYNFMQVGSNAQAFVSIGRFSEEEGLQMNASRSRGHDDTGRQVSLYKIQSICNNTDDCPSARHKKVSAMESKTEHEFAILASIPVHHSGTTFFTCGQLNTEDMFQNLVALAFAVDTINRNQSILADTKLGLIAFDYCSRYQKAEEQIYSYYSSEHSSSGTISTKPKSVVAALTYSSEVANKISSILEAVEVAQVIIPATSEIQPQKTIPAGAVITSPSVFTKVKVIIEFLMYHKWRNVYLLYSKDNFGRIGYKKFSELAGRNNICISGVLDVGIQGSVEEMAQLLQKKVGGHAGMVVLLCENIELVKQLMKASESHRDLVKSQWIVTGEYSEEPIHHGTIFVRTDSKELPDFKRYLSRLSPGKHDPIPDLWFDEFWQHHFRCRLVYSKVIQTQYQTECSGDERIDPNLIDQAKFVSQTVHSVNAVAKGLQNYLKKHCYWAGASVGIDDCGSEARSQLSEEIMEEVAGPLPCFECGPKNSAFGYQLYQVKHINGTGDKMIQIGYWKNDKLELQEEDIIVKPNINTECVSYKATLTGRREQPISRDLSLANFKTLWGIILTALSILGIVLVIICALYFLVSFPVAVGTTVLGYMILIGLLMLYTINFAFIVTPTESTCGIRRFTLGLAYSVIFSGLLVKVINMWRMMGYQGNRMMDDGTKLSSPAGLLVIAVGLVTIQVILTAAWLVLIPPKVGMYNDVWRCAPPSTSEEELVISLVYVMLLLAVTIIFSFLTWKCQDNNRESRWILACCLFVTAVWIAWTILWTQMPVRYRDATTVVANLICATAVMIFLYLRKVYLYSKLTSQARDREMTASLQPSSYAPSLYGTLHKSNLTAVLYGSQASLNGKMFSGGNRSRSAWFTDDAKSDSSGSVQVQATDLYPLDMYDGGSQFQPGNPIYSSKHLVMMDDSIPFTR